MTRFTYVNGNIATVVVFLVWVYVSAVILLWGVEFTAAYAKMRRDIRAGRREVQHGRGKPDIRGQSAESSGARAQPVSAAARRQSGRLVSVGDEAFDDGGAPGQADLPVDRLLDLPLVPRDGARVVRERRRSRRC